MNTLPTPAAPATTKKILNSATVQLYWVAVRIPAIARKMGLHLSEPGDSLSYDIKVPWLVKRHDELTFDPDKFAEYLGVWSSGECHAALFLLNVWNPSYAKDQGWTFNLFDAVGTLGNENINGIVAWMRNPVWP